jgi:hypothetical protein
MFAHERSLVQRYANQPFALLGVNADASPFELRRLQEKAGLTWPSWWDGPNGSIATIWGVDRFPAFFLIDAEGVVKWRHVGVPSEKMIDDKIDEALKDATQKQSKS